MDVLLLGADNPVGIALQGAFSQWGRHQAIPINTTAGRFRSERQAKKAARKARPDAVVDTRLAWQVAAGEHPDSLDIERCHWIAKACERSDMRYVLLSSDRVFSGSVHRQLRESDAVDAQDALALPMIEAEQRVQEAAPQSLILRTGPLFASFEQNLLTGFLDRIEEARSAECDNLHSFCPVASVDAARITAAILDQIGAGAEPAGIYHYCSSDRTTAYSFAEAALAAASQYSNCGDVVLHAHRDDAAGSEQMRVLDCSRLLESFAIKQVPWRGFINAIVKQYYAARKENS